MRGLLAALLLAGAMPALAADRYVVGYATRDDEGPALTVVSVVTLETTDASDDALRAAFAARLEGRKERFLPDVAVFATQAEAEAFRTGLLERAAASGAVEKLAPTVVEQAPSLWRKHEKEFQGWPFGTAEAKRRQLRAAELWKLPLTMRAGSREFILIPPGEFMMGSPADEPGRKDDETQHRVRITAPYYLARDDEPFDNEGWGSTLEALLAAAPEGYRFRLPTEAEWEHAARAGTAGAHYGATAEVPADYGASGLPVPDKVRTPGPGRRHAPNAWGLYDMLGHYDEVVADTYLAYPTAPLTVDPRQDKDLYYIHRSGDFSASPGKGFVMRGGHFFDAASDVRAASRRAAGWTFLTYRFISPNGIRLVLERAEAAGRPEGHGSPVFRALDEWQRGLDGAKDGTPPPPAGKSKPGNGK